MNNELTILGEEQIWGPTALEVIKKYGTKVAITDLAIITGAYCSDSYKIDEDSSLKGRTGWIYTKSSDNDGNVRAVVSVGDRNHRYRFRRDGAIRPALPFSLIQNISLNIVSGFNGVKEVRYGEYPQYAVDRNLQSILERGYSNRTLSKSGKSYTFDSTKYNDYDARFNPVVYDEYIYNNEKYVRVKANSRYEGNEFTLSNGIKYKNGDYVWLKVEPVVWLLDEPTKTLISKYGILSGIRFHERDSVYNGDFNTTEMKWYLDTYMNKELLNVGTLAIEENNRIEEKEELKEAMLKLKRRIQK